MGNCEQNFHDNLKIFRVVKGHTQMEMSKIFNVSLSTYRSWENNITPPYAKFVPICKYFNVTADQMTDQNLNPLKDNVMNKVLREDMKANFKAVVKDQTDLLSFFDKANQTNGIEVVYIAGQITGLAYREVFEKFRNRQLVLEAAGFIVINPCEFVSQHEDWKIAMKTCINLLQFAKHISLLPDWSKSKGAILETQIAAALGIKPLAIKFPHEAE